MTLGILAENDGEQRVALTPDAVQGLLKLGITQIFVEKNAGVRAFFSDADYEKQGAVPAERTDIVQRADLLVKIQPPDAALLAQIPAGKTVVAQMNPLGQADFVAALCKANCTAFSLDLVPRSTRAQAMDVLSSMATVAGYKAVLLAAAQLPTFFPMFMTAAGTVKPAKVLILGAGVAGLQAIATAKRLGAVVEAFDVRAAAREEVMSLGGKFVEVEGARENAAAGGYAVEQTDEFKQKQADLIHKHAIQSDVIICTAQIPGRKAPVLIAKATVEEMKPGAVIVDLAASTGGNCAVTENGKTIYHQQVCVIGNSAIPATIPKDASTMFGKNVVNFLKLLLQKGEITLNFDDDILAASCVTHAGAIVSERVRSSV